MTKCLGWCLNGRPEVWTMGMTCDNLLDSQACKGVCGIQLDTHNGVFRTGKQTIVMFWGFVMPTCTRMTKLILVVSQVWDEGNRPIIWLLNFVHSLVMQQNFNRVLEVLDRVRPMAATMFKTYSRCIFCPVFQSYLGILEPKLKMPPLKSCVKRKQEIAKKTANTFIESQRAVTRSMRPQMNHLEKMRQWTYSAAGCMSCQWRRRKCFLSCFARNWSQGRIYDFVKRGGPWLEIFCASNWLLVQCRVFTHFPAI